MAEKNGGGITLIKLIDWFGPLVFGIAAAWGTSQFISGQREQRIQNLETQLKATQEQSSHFTTREEMKLFIDNASEDLREIRSDIRDLRASERNRADK